MDPLQFDYPQLTPFNYAGNKPATHIDIDGLQSTGDEKRNTQTVEKGDTFLGIENSLGLSHGTLQKLNPSLDPQNLQIGTSINTSAEVGSNEIRGISGLDLGLINFDFTAISKSGQYTINPIVGGANAGNWLVRRYFENGTYENILVGGKSTFADLCRENFTAPEIPIFETPSTTEKSRTAIDLYNDLTNEQEAMDDFFKNPSWDTFAYKRFLNQFTSPMNWLSVIAGSPRVFKAKVKFSRSGLREFKYNNPRSKGLSFKNRKASRQYDMERYLNELDKKAVRIGSHYDNRYNTAVTNLKTIHEILNKRRNE